MAKSIVETFPVLKCTDGAGMYEVNYVNILSIILLAC
jgi:hypothetical protein